MDLGNFCMGCQVIAVNLLHIYHIHVRIGFLSPRLLSEVLGVLHVKQSLLPVKQSLLHVSPGELHFSMTMHRQLDCWRNPPGSDQLLYPGQTDDPTVTLPLGQVTGSTLRAAVEAIGAANSLQTKQ